MIDNLLDNLRDDGFSQVFAVCPQGLDLGLRQPWLALPIQPDCTPQSLTTAPND